jgi:hypothetical protein
MFSFIFVCAIFMVSNTSRLLVDVRNQDEIETVQYNLDGSTQYKTVLYIPSNMIQYNLEWLKEYFKTYDTIDLICKSGTRSKKVKDKYFAENEKVQVKKEHFNTLEKEDVIQTDKTHYSITRKIQIISGTIVLLLFGLLFFHEDVKYMFLVFGSLMLYVGLSGNCFMSPILTKDDI